MKTLYILIGLKGSGKTFIGKIIEREFSIPFLRVENIFKIIKGERHFSDENYIKEGFALLENDIRGFFDETDRLTIESTGLTDEFTQMLENLRKDFSVKLIKIEAEPELCMMRVRERDSKEHINVSDSDIEKINEMAVNVKFDYDLVIDNNGNTSIDLRGFENLLGL